MILYSVFDGDEYEVTFPTKREALAAGRENNATVTRIEIQSPITREVACSLINGEGYAISQTVIYQPIESLFIPRLSRQLAS